MNDLIHSFQQNCTLLRERKVASFVNTQVERSKAQTCLVSKSSSIYHKHPEWTPKQWVFKAKPVPKHIYLSSEHFLKVKRKPYNPEIKPFSFYERDKDIEKRKMERLQKVIEQEKKMREYRARPVPAWVFKYTLSSPDIRNLQRYCNRQPYKPSGRGKNRNKAAGDARKSTKKKIEVKTIEERGEGDSVEEKAADKAVKDTFLSPPVNLNQSPSTDPHQKRNESKSRAQTSDPGAKDKTQDRKAMLIRSKAEQNISIKPEVKPNKAIVKYKRPCSACIPKPINESDRKTNNQPIRNQNNIGRNTSVIQRAKEKNLQFELKKKPFQKEKIEEKKCGPGKVLPSVKMPAVKKYSSKVPSEEMLEPEDETPAVPKNSVEDLSNLETSHYADGKMEGPVNSIINYGQFFEELKDLTDKLQAPIKLIAKPSVEPITKPPGHLGTKPIAKPSIQTISELKVQPIPKPKVEPIAKLSLVTIPKPPVLPIPKPPVQPLSKAKVEPIVLPVQPIQKPIVEPIAKASLVGIPKPLVQPIPNPSLQPIPKASVESTEEMISAQIINPGNLLKVAALKRKALDFSDSSDSV